MASIPQTTVGGGTPGEFTITLSAPQPKGVKIGYKITGTAINGTDFASLSATDVEIFDRPVGAKVIQAGKTSANIKVKPIGDLSGAAMKTVTLVLDAGLDYTVDLKPAATVEILGGK